MTITQRAPLARRGLDGLAQIGPSKFDLHGIRFMADNEGAEGAGSADSAAQGDAGNAAGDSNAPWTKDNFDPERAQKLVENLRGDIAAEKDKREKAIAEAVTAAEKNILGNIAKALGGGQEQETDPVKLNQSLTDLTSKLSEKDTALTDAAAQIKAANVALQVAIHAPALGGNTALLLANEQFKTAIASVEPTDQAAITAEITKALQANAALKQPPARSGDVAPTGPTIQSLEAQLKAAVETKDITETIRLKRAIASARTAQA